MESEELHMEVRPKGRMTLVGVELFALGIYIAFRCERDFALGWDMYTVLIAGIILALGLFILFMAVKWFRYLFSIVFSLFWGLLAFMLAENFTASKAACWVTFGLVALVTLSLHKDYFRFQRRVAKAT